MSRFVAQCGDPVRRTPVGLLETRKEALRLVVGRVEQHRCGRDDAVRLELRLQSRQVAQAALEITSAERGRPEDLDGVADAPYGLDQTGRHLRSRSEIRPPHIDIREHLDHPLVILLRGLGRQRQHLANRGFEPLEDIHKGIHIRIPLRARLPNHNHQPLLLDVARVVADEPRLILRIQAQAKDTGQGLRYRQWADDGKLGLLIPRNHLPKELRIEVADHAHHPLVGQHLLHPGLRLLGHEKLHRTTVEPALCVEVPKVQLGTLHQGLAGVGGRGHHHRQAWPSLHIVLDEGQPGQNGRGRAQDDDEQHDDSEDPPLGVVLKEGLDPLGDGQFRCPL